MATGFTASDAAVPKPLPKNSQPVVAPTALAPAWMVPVAPNSRSRLVETRNSSSGRSQISQVADSAVFCQPCCVGPPVGLDQL